MDGKGRWVDNVFVERLWRSVDGVSGDCKGTKPSVACARPTSGRPCRRDGVMYGQSPNGARRRIGTTPAEAGPPTGGSRRGEAVSGRKAEDIRPAGPHRPVQPEEGQAGGDGGITAAGAAGIGLVATVA